MPRKGQSRPELFECPFCFTLFRQLKTKPTLCPGCGVGYGPASATRHRTDALDQPRRIIPSLGSPDQWIRDEQMLAQDKASDIADVLKRRRTARFMIRLYPTRGRDPRKGARAELWHRMPSPDADPAGMGGWWNKLIDVSPDRVEDLKAEAQRRNGGRPLAQWELHVVTRTIETRGRPRGHASEWEQDYAAYFAGRMTIEEIRAKYSKGRRCYRWPECPNFLPDAWPRKACSAACSQQAYLSRRKTGGSKRKRPCAGKKKSSDHA